MWKALRAIYQALSALSTATWLWGLLPVGLTVVITGWIAQAEHLPPVVIGVLALTAGVVVYVLYVAVQVHRRKPEIAAEPATLAERPGPQELNRLPELEQLYLADFKEGPGGIIMNVLHEQDIKTEDGTQVQIKYQIVLLYAVRAKLLAVYIPAYADHEARVPSYLREYRQLHRLWA
jgi:hypothetical protein